jgi:hypothetical protein
METSIKIVRIILNEEVLPTSRLATNRDIGGDRRYNARA